MGTFNVTRIRYEDHTVRWDGSDPERPMRTSSIALEGDEIVVYERFTGDRPPTTFRCHVMDFLDGMFQRSLKEDFGPEIVKEVLASIRALRPDARRVTDAALNTRPPSLLGAPKPLLSSPAPLLSSPAPLLSSPAPLLSSSTPSLLPDKTPSLLPDKTPSLLLDETPALLPERTPSLLPDKTPSQLRDGEPILGGARPEDAWAGALEPVRAARLARAKARGEQLEELAATATRFDVQLVECGVVDLTLVVALKRITGADARLLAKTLASLPYTVSRDVEADEARALQKRLLKLGAKTKLQPAA